MNDGMVYVGTGMRALGGYAPDPALIDPSLPVDRVQVDRSGSTMGYWPSYSEISPEARAGYLEWLHGGRRDPAAYIGYVFLFLYGLERRLLFDSGGIPVALEEVPLLLQEVRGLLTVYGSSNSFQGYASSLLDIVEIAQGRIDPLSAHPEVADSGWGLSARTRFVLGSLIAQGRPIPPEWALSWWEETSQYTARTPAARCPDEFDTLFRVRYREVFGDGMMIKANRTALHLEHRPASASFPGSVEIHLDAIPDVATLSQPVTELQKLADGVCQELSSYSRWVGRHEDRTSPAAVALLPPELAREAAGEEARSILEFIEAGLGTGASSVIETTELISRWPSTTPGKLSKREAEGLAEFLGHFGYGIEPDVRFGGRNLSNLEKVAVFRSADASLPPGKEYGSAAVLLRFGAAVVGADQAVTQEEEQHLERHLEESLKLEPHARERLRARLRWLLVEPHSMAGLARKIERLNEEQRRQTARFLLALAGADGHVSPPELKILTKGYKLLGLNPESVYADVHALEAGGSEPVTVIPGEAPAVAAIPGPPSGDVVLDRSRIETILGETKEVGRMLEAVFVAEEEEEESEVAEDASAIQGLDPAHANLVQALLSSPQWPRERFDRLAEEHGLMPGGAIETINDFFFGLAGEPLLEGDDPMEVNSYAAKELGS